MKAITVLQPWAWAIIDGRKRVENRSWRTSYRGRLWIHAGKSRNWLERLNAMPDGSPVPAALSFGVILGSVRLLDCVPVATMGADPWASGPWCWLLADPEPLAEPVPCIGRQMLWTPSAEILECLKKAS